MNAMSKLDRIALSLMCCAAFYALWLAAPRQSSGADGLVRYVQRDKETGEYEEGTRSVSVNEMTPDGIALEYESKGEKKSFNLPAEQIVWLQYADEPLELGAARVEIQVGNYEDALEKLGAIEEEIKEPAIKQEIEWNRAYAAIQSALADSGKLESGAAAMKTFVEAYPNHYRFYEGNALLADAAAALGRAPAAGKYYTALTGAKSASYQARGKVGLANLSLDAGELDKAKSLYSEVADMDELDGQLAGFDARAAARVIPERDTPGRMAIACAMPITIAWKNPTPSLPRDRKRVAVSTSPVKTSAAPTSFGEAKASSIRSLSRIPTTAAGTALTMIFTQ